MTIHSAYLVPFIEEGYQRTRKQEMEGHRLYLETELVSDVRIIHVLAPTIDFRLLLGRLSIIVFIRTLF